MLPKIEEILHQHLIAAREAREREPSLLDGVLHANASDAGKCARAIGFKIANFPATNPPGPDSLINFYIGDSIHDIVQKSILDRWPDAKAEVKGKLEDYITARVDVLYPSEDEKLVTCEIKTVSDFAFEKATALKLKSNGRWAKKAQEPEGPKREHILQNTIGARILKADYIAVVYIRKTATKDEPILHEWRYRTEKFQEQTEQEINRLRNIVGSMRQNKLPEREYEGNIIENPSKVKFPCGYCNYKDACVSIGPGVVEIK